MKRIFTSFKTSLGYAANSFGAWCRFRFEKRPYTELIKEKEENYKWFISTFIIALVIAIMAIFIQKFI